MAIKSEILAKIKNALSLTTGMSTWSKLESYLHTESESILENAYADTITDTHITQTVTTSNSNFKYSINIQKSFRRVTLNGQVIVQNNVGANVTILEISEAEFQTLQWYYTSGTNQNGETVKCNFENNILKFKEPVQAGETFDIKLTYFTTN